MAKIKTKTHSGAKKRFKVTANGKGKYQKTNKRHRLTQKDTKRKRIARTVGIADVTNAPALKKLRISKIQSAERTVNREKRNT